MSRLPTDAASRKSIPLSDVTDYFPDALCDVARLIAAGQTQHNTTGWDRSKSADHDHCLLRHHLERGTRDTDGMRHSTKRAIRALMALQLEIEAEEGLPPSRGSTTSKEAVLDMLTSAEEELKTNLLTPDIIFTTTGKPVEPVVSRTEPVQLEFDFGGACTCDPQQADPNCPIKFAMRDDPVLHTKLHNEVAELYAPVRNPKKHTASPKRKSVGVGRRGKRLPKRRR